MSSGDRRGNGQTASQNKILTRRSRNAANTNLTSRASNTPSNQPVVVPATHPRSTYQSPGAPPVRSLLERNTRERSNRLSLPFLSPAAPFSSRNVGSLRRTNPSEEYFNDVGQFLESDSSDFDNDPTPRNNDATLRSHATPRIHGSSLLSRTRQNQPSFRSSVSGDVVTTSTATSPNRPPASVFPISRSRLISSRGSRLRPSALEDDAGAAHNETQTPVPISRAAATTTPSSEFNQVISELFPEASQSRGVSTSDTIDASGPVDNVASTSVGPTSTVSTNYTRASVRTGAAIVASASSRPAPVSRVSAPLTDATDDEIVESVDAVLNRIRTRNSTGSRPEEPTTSTTVSTANSSSPSITAGARVQSDTVVTVASGVRPANSVSRSLPRMQPASSAVSSVSHSPPMVSAVSSAADPTVPTSSTSTLMTAASSDEMPSLNSSSSRERSRAPRIPLRDISSSSQSSPYRPHMNYSTFNSDYVDESLTDSDYADLINMLDSEDSEGPTSSVPYSSRSTSDRSRVDQPGFMSNNNIFDDPDELMRDYPTARETSITSTDSELASSALTPAVPRRSRMIGVRFTNLGGPRSGLSAEVNVSTVEQSDTDSDETTEETPRPSRERGDTPTADNGLLLNDQMQLLQLLGVDLPTSATEVILLNQRSILEQLLETYIMLMMSLQNQETATRPVGLNAASIDALPREAILKAQVTDSLSCSICLANFELEESATKLPCTHLFHHVCITDWLKKSPTCPMCRTAVPAVPENPSTDGDSTSATETS